MQPSNLTLYQRLNRVLGFDNANEFIKANRYSIHDDEIIRTTSKEEYELAKLQAKQTMYLKNMWHRVDNEMYQQAIHYETTRVASYADFEAMEFYPEIAAAMDIIAEESTTLNNKGKVLNIYSDSERVKSVLSDLFFNRLDLHSNLPMWTRNAVKYGDNFCLLNIDDKNGIIGIKQLPNIEMERHETDLVQGIISGNQSNKDNKLGVKFSWRGKNITFNSWQIAHFRLLMDDRRLPYGASILEKARQIWKRLLLSEDAMLVYRLTRAIERRVYKIYVGNIDDQDVEPYVNKITNKFKRTPIIDPKTGQIDLRYNMLPVWKNTPIPLIDGRVLTIEELSKELKFDRGIWVYSIKDETNEIVPGKVIWCDKNYTAKKMIKVWVKDDIWFMTAPEHPFILRNGEQKNAEDLKVGEKLMPFKKEKEYNHELIYNPASNIFEPALNVLSGLIETEKQTESGYLSHEITKIEEVCEGDDVYCMTVVGPDGEDDRHNFAMYGLQGHESYSDYGIFVKNSQDQDFFIPVRDENSPNPIDVLPAAGNLDAIVDIEYLQKKLVTALRVPKTFLGFEEPTGEGKNLALQDIRFSRTINRIQQAMLQELNKIAIIHLYMLGLEDDLDNFSLSLNNPSTQADMLKIEHMQQRVNLYKDAVSDGGNGFSAMSMTRAKKEILGFTNDETKQDLLEQRMERAAAAELEKTALIIKKTGFFDKVDKIYGDPTVDPTALEAGEEAGKLKPSAGGGGGIAGGIGGGEIPGAEETEVPEEIFGAGETPEVPEVGGEVPGAEETEAAGEEAEIEAPEENIKKAENILTEKKNKLQKKLNKRQEKYSKIYSDRLLESINPTDIVNHTQTKIYDKNIIINENINNMINDIDKMLSEDENS